MESFRLQMEKERNVVGSLMKIDFWLRAMGSKWKRNGSRSQIKIDFGSRALGSKCKRNDSRL